ncbi:Toxin CfTX-1 [Exaiptasia diaphana]|nr:Toxin CfTX-1 [Exaiptasia diaphana]
MCLHSAPPTQLITDVQTKLAAFTGPVAARIKTSLSSLNTKWANFSNDQRKDVMGTMGVISQNIVKFGNAAEDPVGAFKAGVDILASIAGLFGPKGQLVSMGLSFLSGILSLFGKGSAQPKPIAVIVREQVDAALREYKDKQLTEEAGGLIIAFQNSMAYLEGVIESGKPVTKWMVGLLSQRVPIAFGSKFMGRLVFVNNNLFSENKATEARRFIKYCELFAKLEILRDMMITQLISMRPSNSDDDLLNDKAGLLKLQERHRTRAELLFKKLYTVDFNSNIMPYFDPDVSPTTDAYSKKILGLGKRKSSIKAGLYCLTTVGEKDLDWKRKYDRYKLSGNPYTEAVAHSNENCYWKIVPHGGRIYSIVNRYKCDEEKYDHCNDLLSWTADGDEAFADIASDDPVLWEIWGYEWKYIRSKWGCATKMKSPWCNYHLRTKYKRRVYGLHPLKLQVGQLAPKDGKYYWKLTRIFPYF